MPKSPSTGPRSGARLRAGGVALRPGKGKGQLEVLIVSRRRVPDSFTVPAGKFERDTDRGCFATCALRETREEAGVECEIVFDLGWHKSLTKDKLVTQTRFYAMRCVGETGDWMERAERSREWRTIDEASSLVAHNAMLAQVFQTLKAALIDRCNLADPLAPDRADWASSVGTSDDSDGMQDLLWLPEAEEPHSGKDVDLSSPPPEDLSSPAEVRRNSADEFAPFVRQASNHSVSGAGFSRLRASSTAERVTLQNAEGDRFQFYGHQVGGHFCFVKPAPEILRISVEPPSTAALQALVEILAQTVVLKPFEEREYKFYLDVVEGAPALLPHMAKVFGTKHLTHRQVEAMVTEVDSLVKEGGTPLESRMRSHEFQKYICMEDLASSMAEPCILDLKMGFKQRSKRHAPAKRARCRKKALSSTSHRLGFRVCGIHQLPGKHQDKYWGRKASCEALHEACRSFFLPARADAAQRAGLVSHLLGNIRDLREAVAMLPHWRFWSTSLLFLYDGADPNRAPVMRMIDFPHCTRVREEEADAEYIAGLRNLETFLSAVLGGHPYAPWVCEQLVPPPPEERQDADEREDDEDSQGQHVDFP